jgi:hypothetical protein
MDGAVTGYPGGSANPANIGVPCKITAAWSPVCYLLWEPDENAISQGNPGAFEYNDSFNFPNASEGIGRLHSKNGGNAVGLDGHVDLVTRIVFTQMSAAFGPITGPRASGRNFLW